MLAEPSNCKAWRVGTWKPEVIDVHESAWAKRDKETQKNSMYITCQARRQAEKVSWKMHIKLKEF